MVLRDRILWEYSANSGAASSAVSVPLPNNSSINNGVFFMDVIAGLICDGAEIKAFLSILINFLVVAERSLMNLLNARKNAYTSPLEMDKISPMVRFVLNARIGISGVPLMDRLFPEPKVMIHENGKITKMTVPSVRTVAAHSAQIASLIEVST
jgi:hypothetical protein